MENTHEGTPHLIDTQEQGMENNDIEQEKLYEDRNDDLINEEELDHIHPDIYHNFPSSKMNSGIMLIFHNDPENIIYDPEDFIQYRS